MEPINRIENCYQTLKSQGQPPLILHSGNPNLQGIKFPQELLQKAYQKAITKNLYEPEPKGLLIARQAISQYYAQQNCYIPPEQILLTSGTSESFAFLFRLLAAKTGHILAPIPAYPLFDHIADYTQTQLQYYSLVPNGNAWAIDWKQLKSRWNQNTRAILLISPHNPTGWVATAEDFRQLTEFCNRYQTALICDEVFSEFYFGSGDYPRAAQYAKPQLCFTLNGISKMLALPGLKLGWIGVTGEKPALASALDTLETYNDTFLSANILIQQALPELLQNASSFIKTYQQEVQQRRQLALEILEKAEFIKHYPPQGGFYFMAELKKHVAFSEEEWIIQLMQKKGIFVYPGYFYDYEASHIHLIISFLTAPETLRLGLKKIIEFSEQN